MPFSLNLCVALIITSCFEMDIKTAHNQTNLPYTSSYFVSKISEMENFDVLHRLLKHVTFLQNLHQIKASPLCGAIVALCYENVCLTGYLWTHLFPKLWNLFDNNVKTAVGKQLETFFTSYVESYCGAKWPVPLIVFTKGVLNCLPPVPLNPAFHKFFGSLYNMWQRSSMLFFYEDHIYLQNKMAINCDVCLELLSEAYSSMEEENLWYGLWKKYGKYQETIIGITYEQQGYFHQACKMYQNAMLKYKNNFGYSYNKGLDVESKLWPNHWIRSVKELGQWNFSNASILPVDKSIGNKHSLIIEKELPEICVCKSLKITLLTWIGKQNYCEEILNSFIKSPMMECLEKRSSFDVTEALTEAVLFFVDDWKSLPSTISKQHFSLLKAMKKMREFEEAIEFQNSLKQDENIMMQGVSNISQKWFFRSPSTFENLSFWNEIYLFRQNQFRYLQYEFLKNTKLKTAKVAISLIYMGLFGYNHSTVQIAELYRKHGMPSLCITQLMRIKSTDVNLNALEVCVKAFIDEAYYTSCRQRKVNLLYKAYENFQTENVKQVQEEDFIQINSIKSDLSSAIAIHDLDLNYDPNKKLDDSSMFDALSIHLERSFISSYPKHHLFNIGSVAVECILKACKGKNEIESIHSLSRILFLLTIEDKLGKVVADNDYIPESHWLPWLPQLLSIHLQSKYTALSSLIKRIGKKYPQSLYIHLQSLCSNTVPGNFKIESMRNASLEELLTDLKCNFPCLDSTLKLIFDQLIELKKNKYESILRILQTCLEKVYSTSFESLKIGSDLNHLNELSSFLIGQFGALKSNWDSHDFKEMKKELLERCLREKGLNSMLAELSKWIKFYSHKILGEQRQICCSLKSHFLSTFHWYEYEVDMFTSGLIQPKLPYVANVRISRFLPTVEFVRKYNDVVCKFYIKGDDGKVYPFTFISHPFIKNIGKENNVSRFLSFLNHILMNKRETLKYFLKINVPDVITISSNVHIVQDNGSSLSLTDIYEQILPQRSTEIEDDGPLVQYYNLVLFGSEGKLDKTILYDNALFMLNIFVVMQKNVVPDTVLKDWARAVYENAADYFKFRNQFAKDIALAGFLKKVFCLTSQNPDKIFVHQDHGTVTNFGYQFKYTTTGPTCSSEWVPFRLTPNISNFLTPAGVEGIFTPIMQATARCFQKHDKLVENLLKVFWLDDILQDKDQTNGIEDCIKNIFNYANLVSLSIGAELASLSNSRQLGNLIKSAEDPKNLCLMNPKYFPWL